MLLTRRFEEKVEERFRAGELPGFLHVAIGQEAVCVGVCRAMEDGDVFASTHRAHGHTLSRPWGWPAFFVCENNHWAESTPASQHLPIEDLAQRAEAFGMHSITVDGQDVEEVWNGAHDALDHARSGEGPVFLLANTYRLTGHYVGDPQVYRDKEEFRETRETQDPLDKLRDKLELSNAEWERLDAEVTKVVEESVEFAKAGTDPAPEDALKNVYA